MLILLDPYAWARCINDCLFLQRVLPFLLGEPVLDTVLDDTFSYSKSKFNQGKDNSNHLQSRRFRDCSQVSPRSSHSPFLVMAGANKDNTGRVVMCREVGIGRAYTFESSYCGAQHSLAISSVTTLLVKLLQR